MKLSFKLMTLISLLASLGASAAFAGNYVCSTASGGYSFSRAGDWEYQAREAAIRDCQAYPYTNYRECQDRVYCYYDSNYQPYPPYPVPAPIPPRPYPPYPAPNPYPPRPYPPYPGNGGGWHGPGHGGPGHGGGHHGPGHGGGHWGR